MSSRLVTAFALAVVVTGCPSKEGEQKDAQTSTSSGGGPVGTGPLAALESSPFANEVWRDEGGQQLQMIYFTRENVRISGPCRMPDGKLACEAIRFLRSGSPVLLPKREIDGRTSAGVKACRKLGYQVQVLRNPMGSEDSVCRFPDGSLLANGALEQYGMRVME
jgi:putative hemolysin